MQYHIPSIWLLIKLKKNRFYKSHGWHQAFHFNLNPFKSTRNPPEVVKAIIDIYVPTNSVTLTS